MMRQLRIVGGLRTTNLFGSQCPHWIKARSLPGRAKQVAMATSNNLAWNPRKNSNGTLFELPGEFFHCCIFAGNFTSLSTVQSYLCGD
jgi:hypothetical protein